MLREETDIMPEKPKAHDLRRKARIIRKHVVRMIGTAGSGHPGGSLSATDILTVLFFHEMKHKPDDPGWPDRDRFILSKGHAAPALYAAYAESGYCAIEDLDSLRKLGSPFQGHPDMRMLPFLEASTGSLGQGLSIGIGMALAARIDGRDAGVYVLLGDGEIQEGQVWEAAMFATHHRIGNLTAIVDYNKQQLDGWIENILEIKPLADKWESFGWHTLEIDGHDIDLIVDAFDRAREIRDRPSIIIAHTTKGKGVDFMEDNPDYHGMAPSPEDTLRALEILDRESGDEG
jgi:transketolase